MLKNDKNISKTHTHTHNTLHKTLHNTLHNTETLQKHYNTPLKHNTFCLIKYSLHF